MQSHRFKKRTITILAFHTNAQYHSVNYKRTLQSSRLLGTRARSRMAMFLSYFSWNKIVLDVIPKVWQ